MQQLSSLEIENLIARTFDCLPSTTICRFVCLASFLKHIDHLHNNLDMLSE